MSTFETPLTFGFSYHAPLEQGSSEAVRLLHYGAENTLKGIIRAAALSYGERTEVLSAGHLPNYRVIEYAAWDIDEDQATKLGKHVARSLVLTNSYFENFRPDMIPPLPVFESTYEGVVETVKAKYGMEL